MISIIRITDHHPGGKRSSAIYEFTCSSSEDIEKLPTSHSKDRPYKTTYPKPGSTCICIDGGISKFILGADDVWHEIPLANDLEYAVRNYLTEIDSLIGGIGTSELNDLIGGDS